MSKIVTSIVFGPVYISGLSVIAASSIVTNLELLLDGHSWSSVSTYQEEYRSFDVDYLVKVINFSLISLIKWVPYWNRL